jgi:uncharacterized protein YndB with AHSA1/START domain
MLKITALIFFLVVVGVLVFAATRPDTFRVTRSATIKAPPEKIFPLVANFKRWTAWSPWEKKDPNLKRSYGGAAEGKGATYAWEGDRNVGQGRMEITDAAAPGRVAIKLDFLKPFETHNTVLFTLTGRGESTEVTWDMQGPASYLSKLIGVFVNMDRMVGGDFEAGLANLKAVAEK